MPGCDWLKKLNKGWKSLNSIERISLPEVRLYYKNFSFITRSYCTSVNQTRLHLWLLTHFLLQGLGFIKSHCNIKYVQRTKAIKISTRIAGLWSQSNGNLYALQAHGLYQKHVTLMTRYASVQSSTRQATSDPGNEVALQGDPDWLQKMQNEKLGKAIFFLVIYWIVTWNTPKFSP